ncbi:MAG TPA: phosphoribosylanthranilate isomerase [Candidatus Babeliales bacterium]|nr:phosphoribosylanthranilate isomerase [Candidatus Babeliales bacterium]
MAETWIKFCGCTAWSDVELAIEARADAFGMIFAPSPRQISLDAARDIAQRLPPSIEPVAVFVNPARHEVQVVRELFPRALLQFSGNESPEFVADYGERAIKAIHVDKSASGIAEAAGNFPYALLLLDTRHGELPGGTGKAFAWESAVAIAQARRVIVAGGLTADNVAECVRGVRPFGVDVRSGIETAGRKDPAKMRDFVASVRAA